MIVCVWFGGAIYGPKVTPLQIKSRSRFKAESSTSVLHTSSLLSNLAISKLDVQWTAFVLCRANPMQEVHGMILAHSSSVWTINFSNQPKLDAACPNSRQS
jgi:hypothetical protein